MVPEPRCAIVEARNVHGALFVHQNLAAEEPLDRLFAGKGKREGLICFLFDLHPHRQLSPLGTFEFRKIQNLTVAAVRLWIAYAAKASGS